MPYPQQSLWSHLIVVTALLVGGPLGCKGGDSGSKPVASSAAATGEVQAGPTLAGATIVVDGRSWSVAKHDKGYRLESDGAKLTVKIADDRVKVKDASDTEVAKVKRKSEGFKLYRGDAEVLRGKKRSGGYKLKRLPGDAELGSAEDGGSLGGDALSAHKDGDVWVVSRAGKEVGRAPVVLPKAIAMLLAVTEVEPPERLALVVFAAEVDR